MTGYSMPLHDDDDNHDHDSMFSATSHRPDRHDLEMMNMSDPHGMALPGETDPWAWHGSVDAMDVDGEMTEQGPSHGHNSDERNGDEQQDESRDHVQEMGTAGPMDPRVIMRAVKNHLGMLGDDLAPSLE